MLTVNLGPQFFYMKILTKKSISQKFCPVISQGKQKATTICNLKDAFRSFSQFSFPKSQNVLTQRRDNSFKGKIQGSSRKSILESGRNSVTLAWFACNRKFTSLGKLKWVIFQNIRQNLKLCIEQLPWTSNCFHQL